MVESQVVVDRRGLDGLMEALAARGYRVLGPVVRDGAVVPGETSTTADLPVGVRDRQEPGTYRLDHFGDDALFAWAVGPASWKATFFPPEETVWRATVEEDRFTLREVPGAAPGAAPMDRSSNGTTGETPAVALFGARPCEVAALSVLDRVLRNGAVPDPRYQQRRAGTFVLAADCGAPASTCFCTSTGTGPVAADGFDLAVAELANDSEEGGYRYLVRVGSPRGADVLEEVEHRPADQADVRQQREIASAAATAMTRKVDTGGLPGVLARRIDHPRWEEIGQRCLSCGNCTMVCPTCFCSDVHDVSDLRGTIHRRRSWASCFDRAHSYIRGGPVRPTTASCYRQWLTHKLGTWRDQFGTSGCVGCGRCITWCPVGIDVTVEAGAFMSSAGAD